MRVNQLRRLWMALMILMVLPLAACTELPGTDPDIVSLTVTPADVPLGSTTMTDEYFSSIVIQTANFPTEPTVAEVFIQDVEGGNKEATPEKLEINGDSITLVKVPLSWLSGLEAGTYNVGAKVATENDETSVTELNLATITISQ